MSTLPAFASALQAWCTTHSEISLRQLDRMADVANLSQFRAGTRRITFDALRKLLPTIEAASTRKEAITLLVAYLTDETPPDYAPHIRIEPLNEAGETQLDTYAELAQDWESLARMDPKFHAVWSGLNDFIQHPERITQQSGKSPEDIAADIGAYTTTHQNSGGKVTLYTGLPQPQSRVAETAAQIALQKAADEVTAHIEQQTASPIRKKSSSDPGKTA